MSTAWFLIPIAWVLWKGWRIAYPRVHVRLEFKLADCWLGVYWDKAATHTHVWICLLPMLPAHFWWTHCEKPPFPGARSAAQRPDSGGSVPE